MYMFQVHVPGGVQLQRAVMYGRALLAQGDHPSPHHPDGGGNMLFNFAALNFSLL